MDTEKKENEQEALGEYLKNNKDLLTLFGVFIAIATFSNNIPLKLFSFLTFFFSLGCAVLILLELKKKISIESSLILGLFKYFLFLITFILAIFWLTEFLVILPKGIGIILFIVLGEIFAYSLKTFTLQKKMSERIIVAVVLTTMIIIFSCIATIYLEPYIEKYTLYILSLNQ